MPTLVRKTTCTLDRPFSPWFNPCRWLSPLSSINTNSFNPSNSRVPLSLSLPHSHSQLLISITSGQHDEICGWLPSSPDFSYGFGWIVRGFAIRALSMIKGFASWRKFFFSCFRDAEVFSSILSSFASIFTIFLWFLRVVCFFFLRFLFHDGWALNLSCFPLIFGIYSLWYESLICPSILYGILNWYENSWYFCWLIHLIFGFLLVLLSFINLVSSDWP